jgi:Zinc finger, C4 type (two domains)
LPTDFYTAGTSELLDDSVSTDSVIPDFRGVDARTNLELYQDIKPLKSEEEPGAMPLPLSVDSRLGENRTGVAEGPTGALEDLCPVCNDKVSGYHYGLQTCESCKGIGS